MSVIDLEATILRRMTDCWFPADLNQWLQSLTQQEQLAAEKWVHTHIFDAALANNPPLMNVTQAIRRFIPNAPDWTGSPLQPLYDRTGQDAERARLFYGNLVCRVGVMQRPETWWRRKETVGQDQHSSTYILNAHIAALAGIP